MSSQDERVFIELVFLKVGSVDTDEQLERVLAKFLPAVLEKLSSPTEAVRKEVIELLSHINKRVKSRTSIQLPVEALLRLYRDQRASAFVINFTIIYLKMGFPRLSLEKRKELLSVLISAAADKTPLHQEIIAFIVLGALESLPLPNDAVEAKAFLGLSDQYTFKEIFLEIVQDMLLLPYGWKEPTPPPELSPHALKRIMDNCPWISDTNRLERMKLNLVKILSSGVLTNDEVFCPLVLATADSRSTVSSSADAQLRKTSGDLDLTDINRILPLYKVSMGSGEGDRKRSQATTRVALKLLPWLTKARAVSMPGAVKIVMGACFGNGTNLKLKSLGLSFCSNVIHNGITDSEVDISERILKPLFVLLQVEHNVVVTRQCYSVIGQLICKVPQLVQTSTLVLKNLFKYLTEQENSEMQSSIRDTMVIICPPHKGIDASLTEELYNLIVAQMQSPIPKCRAVSIFYMANALPRSPQQLYSLLSATVDPDEEISAEAKKALYGPNYKTSSEKDELTDLFSFTDLLTLIIEKESGKRVNVQLHSEILFYLSLCLAKDSGVKPTLVQISHPCESSTVIGEYLRKLHREQPHLLEQYLSFIYRLLDTEVAITPLTSLLECVGCLPDLLGPAVVPRLPAFKSLLSHTKEETRIVVATLIGLITPLEELPFELNAYSQVLEEGGKDVEKIHGCLLAAGHLVERASRKGFLLTDSRHPSALIKYLSSNQSVLVSGSCSAIGLMGQVSCMPISVEDRSTLTETLLSIVLGAKQTSKVKDRAASTLGLLSVGGDSQDKEVIINKFFDSAKEVRDIELHLSTGETLVNAILGSSSPDSLDPWKRTVEVENALKQNIPQPQLERANFLADLFLNRALLTAREPHPHLRQSCCFWLLAVAKHCQHLDAVKAKLEEIQSAFMDFLSESNSVVQEAAGKGLALVYQSGDGGKRSELLSKVVEQLLAGKRGVNLVTHDTKLFEEGELGKAPTGGGLSTYKELCSLASDLNQPDLIYKFMNLANHNAVWNSKKGAAYGVSSLVEMAGSEIDAHLPKIVAKMYRYQYDPTPSIQQTMVTIWHSLTSSTPNAVETYHKEIFSDLLNNLTSPQWRVRLSCCLALSDFMRGGGAKIFEDSKEKIPELMKDLFRVMDDIHEGTREAATATTKTLCKILVRHCDKESKTAKGTLSSYVLPILLEIGIKNNVSEVRAVSVSTVSDVVKNGLSEELVTKIIPALLIAAAELESTTLNALSVRYSASRQTQDAIDSIRASAVKSHFTVQTLARCVEYVRAEMMDELSGQMLELLRSSVGLGSRIATSHFLVLLSHHLTVLEIQPYIGKFLGVLLSGLSDRNAAVRKNYATTIGQLTRYAKDTSVDRLVAKLTTLYFEKEEESVRSAVAITFQALVNYSQDAIKNRLDLALPIVFFAKHEEKKLDGSNKSILDTWEEVWDDISLGSSSLIQNQEQICDTLEQCMSSSAWNNKAQAARALKSLAGKLGDSFNPERRRRMVEMILSGLSGRTWDGKEHLLDALSALSKEEKGKGGKELSDRIVEAMLKECRKEKMKYRSYALKSLAEIVHNLDIDTFERIYPTLLEVINKADGETSDDAEESLKMSQEWTELKEAAYSTLGKVWPSSPTTQDKYRLEVISECVNNLDKSTRGIQVVIMSTLVMIVGKLVLLQGALDNESDRKNLSDALTPIYKALAYSLGIPKHTALRKEALNLVYSLSTKLKTVNEAEFRRLEEVFNRFSEEIGRDKAPEIKSRFIDIKDIFAN